MGITILFFTMQKYEKKVNYPNLLILFYKELLDMSQNIEELLDMDVKLITPIMYGVVLALNGNR